MFHPHKPRVRICTRCYRRLADPVAICETFNAAMRLVMKAGTLYQKQVYSNLDAMRVFGLPLYIALPWKDTVQHNELLDIVISRDPEYGRAHYPDRIRAAERRAAQPPTGHDRSSSPTR